MHKTRSLDDLHPHHPHRNHELEHIRHEDEKRSELLTGIIDVKLREIGRLESKRDILEECQNWVRDKILCYMNLLDEVEVRYYLQAEELVERLNTKEIVIQQKTRIMGGLEDEIRKMQKTIEGLRNENSILEQQLKVEYQLKEEDTRKYASINKLENLSRQLQSQVQSLQKENLKLADDLSLFKESVLNCQGEIGMLQHQALRLKARLQEQSKKDADVPHPHLNQYKIQYAMSVCIRPPERQLRKYGGKFMRQVMIEGLIVRNKAPSSFGFTGEEPSFIDRHPRYVEMGTQTSSPYLWKVKLQDIALIGNPKQMRAITKNLLKKAHTSPKQMGGEDARGNDKLKEQYKRQLISLQKMVKNLVQQLNRISDKRMGLMAENKRGLEAILDSRPSREEDIQYIHQLIAANKELMELSAEANQKAEKAYEAMRECKIELERYKSSTPMQIRPRLRTKSNPQAPTPPCTSSFSTRINLSSKMKRRSNDEDVLISSILRDSLGSVDFAAMRHGRKLHSSMSNYRDEYRAIHRSIL